MLTLIAATPKVKEVTVKPVWVERTIIFRRPAGNVIALDGWIYGTLAVHSTWDDPTKPLVTITHQPSKLPVARLNNPDEAVAKVEWLWDQCPREWIEERPSKDRVPKEVLEWCKANN